MKIHNEWAPHQLNQDLLTHINSLFQTLPLFQRIIQDSTLESAMKDVEFLRPYKDILIFGIGGSSLGGQALYAAHNARSVQGGAERPNLHFIDNIDPATFNKTLNQLNLQHTGMICISKSGNTAEPLMQFLLACQHYNAQGIHWQKQACIITESQDNALRQYGKQHNLVHIDHPTDIGGRYNIFTSPGAVVSKLMSFDFTEFRRGAQNLIQNFNPLSHLQGAYHAAFLNHHHGVNQSVIMVYADGLELFSEWFCQLWGESLGKKKNGKFCGLTPVRALGAVDQHSQLQLYLDGPRDKLITFITLDQHEKTPMIQPTHIDHPCFRILETHTMDQLFKAEEAGTYETLKKNNCHLRQFSLNNLEAFEMGQLMMYFMIETIATAYLLGVDPFDQPAVEDSKTQAMAFLKNNFKI